MEYSLMYIQSNEQLGKTIKDNLVSEELEVLIAQNAKEAFDILSEREVTMALIDSYIPDMRQRDCLDKLTSEYPRLILNVCMDSAEPSYVASTAKKENIWKIYIPPFSIDKMVEGVKSSMDRICIEKDYFGRQDQFNNEEEAFERTIANLKASLVRQQYSYNVISPFFNALLDSFYDSSTLDTRSKILLTQAARKILLIQTATSIKSNTLTATIEKFIRNVERKDVTLELLAIDNCLLGNVSKKVLGDIVFALWLPVFGVSLYSGSIKVKVDSRYLSSERCEYNLYIFENKSGIDPGVKELLLTLLMAISQKPELKVEGDKMIFTYEFSLAG